MASMDSVASVALPSDVAEYFVEYIDEKYDTEEEYVSRITAPDDVHEELEELVDDSDVLGYEDTFSQITAPNDMYVDGSGGLDYDALVQDVEEAITYGERQERN